MFVLNTPLGRECRISTYTGRQLDLLAPLAGQIDIDDIAHGLAYQPCYNGQTCHFYSLAQRALLVASLVPLPQRLAALLHDAATAYFGDIAPALRQLLPEITAIEKNLMLAISERFSLPASAAAPIKRAQLIALATEQRDVKPSTGKTHGLPGQLAPVPRRIEFISPEEAQYQFKELFTELTTAGSVRKALHAISPPPGSRSRSMPLASGKSAQPGGSDRKTVAWGHWSQSIDTVSK